MAYIYLVASLFALLPRNIVAKQGNQLRQACHGTCNEDNLLYNILYMVYFLKFTKTS